MARATCRGRCNWMRTWSATNSRNGYSIGAGTSISVATGSLGGLQSVTAGTTIDVGGTLFSPQVLAGGNVTAGTVSVQNLTTNGVLTAGSGGIVPLFQAGAGAQHQFTLDSIVSPNGINFNGNFYVNRGLVAPQNGGLLNITANTLTFNKAGIASADFNGSDSPNTAGGSGGSLTGTIAGDITISVGTR